MNDLQRAVIFFDYDRQEWRSLSVSEIRERECELYRLGRKMALKRFHEDYNMPEKTPIIYNAFGAGWNSMVDALKIRARH